MIIKPDQSKSYGSAHEALEDAGFEFIGKFGRKLPISNKWYTVRIFERAHGEYFYFVSMNHYNTTVYSVTVKPFKGNLNDFERC